MTLMIRRFLGIVAFLGAFTLSVSYEGAVKGFEISLMSSAWADCTDPIGIEGATRQQDNPGGGHYVFTCTSAAWVSGPLIGGPTPADAGCTNPTGVAGAKRAVNNATGGHNVFTCTAGAWVMGPNIDGPAPAGCMEPTGAEGAKRTVNNTTGGHNVFTCTAGVWVMGPTISGPAPDTPTVEGACVPGKMLIGLYDPKPYIPDILHPGGTGTTLTCSEGVDPTGALIVSTITQLRAAVDNMKNSGGTILLAPGDYGNLNFMDGMQFGNKLTIASADTSNPAIITSTSLNNLSNVTFANLNFFANGTGALPTGTCGVMNVPGWAHSEPKPCGEDGLKINGANNVTITGSVFSGHQRALFMTGTDIVISNNTFTNSSMDQMAFSNVHNILIEGNYSHGIQPVMSGHNDHIQFWNLGGAAATDVTIRNNVLSNDYPGGIQGLFMFNESVARNGGGTNEFYQNVNIVGNTIISSKFNALVLSATNGGTLRDNIVVANCNQPGRPGSGIYKGNTNMTMTGNQFGYAFASELNPATRAAWPASWTMSDDNRLEGAACQNPPNLTQAPGCAAPDTGGATNPM